METFKCHESFVIEELKDLVNGKPVFNEEELDIRTTFRLMDKVRLAKLIENILVELSILRDDIENTILKFDHYNGQGIIFNEEFISLYNVPEDFFNRADGVSRAKIYNLRSITHNVSGIYNEYLSGLNGASHSKLSTLLSSATKISATKGLITRAKFFKITLSFDDGGIIKFIAHISKGDNSVMLTLKLKEFSDNTAHLLRSSYKIPKYINMNCDELDILFECFIPINVLSLDNFDIDVNFKKYHKFVEKLDDHNIRSKIKELI